MLSDISQGGYVQPGADPGQTRDILEGLQLPPQPAEHQNSLSGAGNCYPVKKTGHSKQAKENKRDL